MLGKLFAKKSVADEPILPEDQVKLKPLFGIRPGVYLAALCALVLLIVLFFIFLYPGLSRPGSVVVFSSEPSGAALRVDDVYIGTSPCRVFVPKGKHTIEAILPGFVSQRTDVTIPSRLFASAVFPRLYPFDVKLNVSAAGQGGGSVLAMAASDYAAWTFAGEPTANWQIPLSLSEGVYRAGSASVGDILSAAARFAVTRAALRDLVRAHTLSVDGGNAPSPLALVRSAAQAASFLSHNDGCAAWLADVLPAESSAVVISSPWYQNQLASFADVTAGEALAVQEGELPALPEKQIRVGGILFSALGGGVVVQGEPFPHRVPIDAFLICSTEVPIPAYADFLDANPQWRSEQKETLEKQGLVDSEYLADFGTDVPIIGTRMNDGISSVSWFAAQAFCEWLTTKLPPAFSGYTVRFPTEAEWEYAAKAVQSYEGRSPVLDRGLASFGNFWEWCGDPYAHLPFISAPQYAINAVGSPERSVRGGSWVNMAGSIGAETRGSLPPQTCSAFVSFRPIIARPVAQIDVSR